MRSYQVGTVGVLAVALGGVGCAAPRKVDFSQIERPQRSEKMDAYDVFVGSWTWEAEMANAAEPDKHWSGVAEWQWGLDRRFLMGTLSAQSQRRKFEARGTWGWHPTRRTYVWWMFNNWGYPQEGTARYDKKERRWTMDYTSVGLDGTKSHGRYQMKVVDRNTLDWKVEEWADTFHLVPKMVMDGTYKRVQ